MSKGDLRVVDGSSAEAVGLEPGEYATPEAFVAAGRALMEQRSGSCWELADWVGRGASGLGATTAREAARGLGISAGKFSDYLTISDSYPKFRRRNSLTFSHHAEVARLSEAERERILDAAEAGGWSRRQVRDAAREASLGRQLAKARAELEDHKRQLRRALAGPEGIRDEAERARQRLVTARRSADAAVKHCARVLSEIMESDLVAALHGNARLGLAAEIERQFNGISDRVNGALDEQVAPALARLRGGGGA